MRERPKEHFTPRANWINDPNGLIFHGGYYHLFFQHNPFGNQWGHMSWGHARSKDLVNWEELPLAIPEQRDHMIFSGSAVFDQANNRLAAFYTAHKPGNQSQWVVFSYDDGLNWIEHQKVLDLNLEEFRDPKVFKYKDKWIMVTVKSTEHLVAFFESRDLINWQFLSDYEVPGVDVLYECPDLFELDGKWVLLLSTNPGGAAGGSGMHYVIGNFNGLEFKESSEVRFLDYGSDYYAAVTFNETNERISIGWMNNWLYANEYPSEIWNGSMTLARKLGISNNQLVQTFIGSTKYFTVPAESNFEFRYSKGAVRFMRQETKLIIDRSELWSAKIQTFYLPAYGELDVTANFDAGSLELLINGLSATCRLEVGCEVPTFCLI